MIPGIIKEADPHSFYWPSSPLAGWYKHADLNTHSGDTHYWDVWWSQKPFEDYNTHIGRFMSEYGFQSFPEFNSVKMYTLPEDWDIFSDVMQAHQRSSIGNGTIKNYMQLYYKVPVDFKKFLYVGEVLQAEGIKFAMEAHRRAMPYCMGSLFWQINDCWPVASWSSIDYYHRWKAQQYFAKKAFDKVLVSPLLEQDKVSVSVVNDGASERNMILDINVMDFNGKTVDALKLPVTLKPNSSEVCFRGEVTNLLHAHAPGNVLLYVALTENHQLISSNILYFVPVKKLQLPVAVIKKSVRIENGGFVLDLTSDKLVKNLCLELSEGNGFFSDNYFDMLPGEKVTVHYQPDDKNTTLEEFLKNLKMLQMAEI
jgi:beta-mannosidase